MENILPNTQVLPWAIANSIVRIYEDKFFSNLHFSTKQVLSTLIRFGLNIENTSQSIFIKKSTIAHLMEVNEATVYRALSKLEEAKLIEREVQNKTPSNFKIIGKIKITSIALKAFGIEEYLERRKAKLQENTTKVSAFKKANTDLAQMQDKNITPLQSLQKQSGQNLFKEIQGRKIPQDLAWLVETNELKISALLKLMKVARQKGKLLSDIVAVRKDALLKTTGRDLYGYLCSLIDTKCDFAYARKKQEEEKAKQQSAAEAKTEAKQMIDVAETSLHGKKFRLDSGQYIEFRGGALEFTDVNGRSEGFCPYQKNIPLIKQAILGSLEPVAEIPQHVSNVDQDKKFDNGGSIKSVIADHLDSLKNLLGLNSVKQKVDPLAVNFI